MQELVRAGARLDIVDDTYWRTPLHSAVLNGFWCRVRTLLMLRSPVNLKDKEGKTALGLALQLSSCNRASNYNIKRIIYLLLEYGADVNTVLEAESKNKNMSVRNSATPVMIRGIWEFNGPDFVIELSFNFNSAEFISKRCFYCVIFAIFDYRGPHARIRMWGESPFDSVSVNGKTVVPLEPDANRFLYPVDLVNGTNQLLLRLKPDSASCKVMLLTQV
ncbi:unnamed protein product [Enterobius vermicularis]|uniref:Uncharacterized protein n=1 Tax=Enterobius vermicularis TaxID=51028 RepID=A0A3P6HYB7_ENTVE|nr:unnamed protein product [Enterobius vermicularis]